MLNTAVNLQDILANYRPIHQKFLREASRDWLTKNAVVVIWEGTIVAANARAHKFAGIQFGGLNDKSLEALCFSPLSLAQITRAQSELTHVDGELRALNTGRVVRVWQTYAEVGGTIAHYLTFCAD